MRADELIELPEHITRLLGGYARRLRRLVAARAMAVASMFAMLWFVAWGVVDRFYPLPSAVRVILLLACVALLIAICAPAAMALARGRIDYRGAARQLEQRDPKLFGEALETIVSVRTGSGHSSRRLVDQIARQVETTIAGDRARLDLRRLAPSRPAVTACVAAAAAGLIVLNLCVAWPALGFSQLLARQIMPLSGDLSPVTSTRLDLLSPGSTQIVQGQPFAIALRVEPPDSATSVVLRTTTDGQRWSVIPLTVAPDGTAQHAFPSISRDLTYQIIAGDAIAGPYTVRVLHRPIVRELRIRLTYPPAVGREPLEMVSSEDATIDVPTGTVAHIAIVASEPLQDASLSIDGSDERVASTETSDPSIREAEVQIQRDTRLQIALLSDRGIGGTGAGELTIRSIPDRAPVARFPGADSMGMLLLRPDAVLELPYQAADDFGLSEISVRIRINEGEPTAQPLPLSPDPRRSDGLLRLKLAELKVAIGDAVSVEPMARDRAGQEPAATPWPVRISIASESITPREIREMAALLEAVRLARAVRDDPGAAPDAAGRLPVALIAAGADAALVDGAQVQAARLGSLNDQRGQRLESRITTLWQGRLSELVLRQLRVRAELRDPGRSQIDGQIKASVISLGLQPGAAELPAQLESKVEASQAMLGALPAIDYVEMARQWATGAAAPAEARLLPERLAAAGQARRSDDLDLAARAARSIESQPPAKQGMREEYVKALAALLGSASESDSARARASMRAWAGTSEAGAEAQAVDVRPQQQVTPHVDSRREQALATIRQAQELMAQMPQQLGKAEQAAAWSRQTQRRVKQAEKDLAAAPATRQPAARRALAAAQAQASDAAQALNEIGKTIDPDAMWRLAQELDAHAPQEQSPAIVPVQRELAPALQSLQDAIDASDPDGAELAAGNARQAIAGVQGGLRRARQALLQRDPLVAAREFADLLADDPGAADLARDAGDDLPGYEDALRAYFTALRRQHLKAELKP